MSTASLKQAARLALVISFSLHAPSASAKDFTEREFRAQALGHGVYELAYDNGQKTLYAASAPSFDKDKTAGLVFRLAADSLRIDEKSLPNAAPSRSPWMKKITSCIWVTRWMAR